MTSSQLEKIDSQLSPWLTPLVYPLACKAVLPLYFGDIEVEGQHNIPQNGPVILAPAHRARWDALVMGYAAGRWATGRDLRFMVSANEVQGIQGWFIRHLGGFPVNPNRPAIASLRYGVEILRNEEMLVIFPEGAIFRDKIIRPLKQGLARLALQSEAMEPGLGTQIVPVGIHYGNPQVGWRCGVKVNIGRPLDVASYSGTPKTSAQRLTADLESSLRQLMGDADLTETEIVWRDRPHAFAQAASARD